MKIFKSVFLSIILIFCIVVIFIFELNSWPVGSSIAGIIIGSFSPSLYKSIQDLFDTTNWKKSQRKLKRGGLINNSSIVRISFAYLYRIKVDDKYLLVKNERGTEKYQPVGGVYKLKGGERLELKKRFHVMDDNKVPIDESSRNDYRLRMENRYLRKFVKRFNRKAEREKIDDLSREFKEELIEKGIVNWCQITYRFCGRHMTDLRYGEHFQIYELLLADVVELIPSKEQENDLRILMTRQSDKYYFASAEEIMSLGINPATGKLKEIIGDHAIKTIQETEGNLVKIPGVNNIYTVYLS